MELFQSLLKILSESEDPEQKAKNVLISKEIQKSDVPGEGSNSSKIRFLIRPKYDLYPLLDQDDPQKLRELKKIYSLLNAERERSQVYGIDNSSKDYARVLKYLNISTDGSITADRIKHAGFSLVGRMNDKRIYRRDKFVIVTEGTLETFEANIYTIHKSEEE